MNTINEYNGLHNKHSDEGVLFSWKDINVFTQEKDSSRPEKQLVTAATGAVQPGELVAIMGASGAGKSTLLNTLTFRHLSGLRVTGDRFVNNCRVTPDGMTSVSAYMQQDELFIGTLTVKEHLTFQAMVRINKAMSMEDQMDRVEEVIDELGLRKSENVLIGIPGKIKGISGGEMKRLALASEMLTNPALLFCDEPTSGLDSYKALTVVETLKKLANQGRTVLVTIHQPASQIYQLFSRILLMAEGKLAFLGTPSEANEVFSLCGHPCPIYYNPPDHFIKTLAVTNGNEAECHSTIDLVCQQYRESKAALELGQMMSGKICKEEICEGKYRASCWVQFKALLWRSWISVLKEPAIIKVRFCQTIWLAILIVLIYYDQHLNQAGIKNINGAIFFFIINMTMINTFSVINVYCMEIPIFLREHFNGLYRTDMYFITRQLADLPMFIITPFLYMSIVYFAVGLNPHINRFLISSAIIELITQAAISFGYFVSCISTSPPISLGIASSLIVPLMLVGGFFVKRGSVHPWLSWLQFFSWFLYGNEALLINQWSGVKFIWCENYSTHTVSRCFRTGEQVLYLYSFEEDNFWIDIGFLVGQMILFKVLAFLCLYRKTIRKMK